jgi:hypothetical protein
MWVAPQKTEEAVMVFTPPLVVVKEHIRWICDIQVHEGGFYEISKEKDGYRGSGAPFGHRSGNSVCGGWDIARLA